MKKSLLLFIVILILLFSLPFYAEENIDENTGSDVSKEIIDDLRSHCYCGREFYAEDGDGHSAYDCLKCGKNMYSCTCNCWCGAKSVLDTSGDYGSVIPLICTGCNKPCLLCTCRSDRAAVLLAEEQRRTGEISSLNILRPQNAFIVIIAVLLTSGVLVFMFFADDRALFAGLPKKVKKEKLNPVEKVPNVAPLPEKNERPVIKGTPGGTFDLYETVALSSLSFTDTPLGDDFGICLTADEISALLRIMKLTPDEASPLKKSEISSPAEVLATLTEDGIIIRDGDGFTIDGEISRCLEDISSVKPLLHTEAMRSRGKYDICCKNGTFYLILRSGNMFFIDGFDGEAALIERLNSIFTVDGDAIPLGADIPLDYGEFSLFTLTGILAPDGDAVTEERLYKPEVCVKISGGLNAAGYGALSEIFASLAEKQAVSFELEKLIKKGFFVRKDDGCAYSGLCRRVLAFDGLNDCLTVRSEENNILFALRDNGVAAFYDDGTTVRILTARSIPWKALLK